MASKEYMALVKTSSGLTPERPYGKLGVASPGAYAEWRALAVDLSQRADERLTKLGDVEASRIAARTQTKFVKYNEFGLGAQGLVGDAHDLPTAFENVGPETLASAISSASRLAVDAAGLIEQIDYSMIYYGTQPPSLKMGLGADRPTNGGLGVLGTLGVFVVIGLATIGTIYVVKRSRTPEVVA